jgi:hypothetical protein
MLRRTTSIARKERPSGPQKQLSLRMFGGTTECLSNVCLPGRCASAEPVEGECSLVGDAASHASEWTAQEIRQSQTKCMPYTAGNNGHREMACKHKIRVSAVCVVVFAL